MVANEEKLYEQQKIAQKQAQKIEAETGSIANDATGEVRMVVPSALNNNVQNKSQAVKVLDFSKKDVIPVNKKPEEKSLIGVVVRD